METKTKTKINHETGKNNQPKDIFTLIKATDKENAKDEDVRALYEQLRDNPQVWREVADLARAAEKRILSNNALQRESVALRLEEMRDLLGWTTASEIERLLIEQVCLSWLRLNLLEAVHHEETSDFYPIAATLAWDKRLCEAQKRHLRAIEALAKTRALLSQATLNEQRAKVKEKLANIKSMFAN